MKLAVVAALLLGACVADGDAPTLDIRRDEANIETTAISVETDEAAQLCAAAAALPETELCSLVCDPDAFAARLVDDGMKTGTCYQIRCTLAPEMNVTVGVCLP